MTEDAGLIAAEMEANEDSEALERSFLYFVKIRVHCDDETVWIGHVLGEMDSENGMELTCVSLITFLESLPYVHLECSLPDATKAGMFDSVKVNVAKARARMSIFQGQDLAGSRASVVSPKKCKHA